MQNVKAWMVIRDGKEVGVRFTQSQAEACAVIEERVYHCENIEVVPVTITERLKDEG